MEGVEAIVKTVQLCTVVVYLSPLTCEVGILTRSFDRLRSNVCL